MRIVAGSHKGRRLETPKGQDIRPTSDKIRAAIFNALNSRGLVVDAVVIDAFCGTGALGLEALSQGAQECYFFDKAKSSIDLCKANIQNFECENQSEIFLMDATKAKEKPEFLKSADLIFLDPPYNQNLFLRSIESLKEQGWLSAEAFFVIETDKKELIESDFISIQSEKIYGDTKITFSFLKKAAVNQAE